MVMSYRQRAAKKKEEYKARRKVPAWRCKECGVLLVTFSCMECDREARKAKQRLQWREDNNAT